MDIQLKNGSIITVHWQEYSIGLYVCIYDKESGRMLDQFGLDVPVKKFIEDLKANKIFDGICI